MSTVHWALDAVCVGTVCVFSFVVVSSSFRKRSTIFCYVTKEKKKPKDDDYF